MKAHSEKLTPLAHTAHNRCFGCGPANPSGLHLEFMLTDGQDVLRNRDFFPARRNAASLADDVPLTFIDPAKALDENQKWNRYFREVIAHSAR